MRMTKNKKQQNIGIGNVSGDNSSSETKIDISIDSGDKKGVSGVAKQVCKQSQLYESDILDIVVCTVAAY